MHVYGEINGTLTTEEHLIGTLSSEEELSGGLSVPFAMPYTETDPTVPEWAKQPNKPSYTAEEVGALPEDTPIPEKVSDLANDAGYLTAETDPTVPAWAKAAQKPSYTPQEVGALPDDTPIPRVLMAVYGTTAYLDIKKEYDSGAVVMCLMTSGDETMILQMADHDSANEVFYFAAPFSQGWYWTSISSAGGWDDGAFNFATTDLATQLRDGLMSALDKQKIDGIASGAEVNVQADWNEADSTSDAYIRNKPSIPAVPTNLSDLTNDMEVSDFPNDAGYIDVAIYYGTCSTAAATGEKAVDCADFASADLKAGAAILVKFTNTNSAAVADIKLNVNSTGAKSVKYINNGTLENLTSAGYLKASTAYLFVYDGTYWVAIFNYNTTYSSMTAAEYQAGTSTTARLITPANLKAAILYHETGEQNVQADWNEADSTSDAYINNKPAIPTVPTNVSAFTNDAGYLTAETDPTVPAWAKAAQKPSYTAQEVGALPDTTQIPVKVSDLQNDSGFLTLATLPIYNGGVV